MLRVGAHGRCTRGVFLFLDVRIWTVRTTADSLVCLAEAGPEAGGKGQGPARGAACGPRARPELLLCVRGAALVSSAAAEGTRARGGTGEGGGRGGGGWGGGRSGQRIGGARWPERGGRGGGGERVRSGRLGSCIRITPSQHDVVAHARFPHGRFLFGLSSACAGTPLTATVGRSGVPQQLDRYALKRRIKMAH